MDVRSLTNEVFVSSQITVSDVASLAAQGFRTIVCNRPDGEADEQPQFSEIEKAAAEHGLSVVYQPVRASAITDSDVDAFHGAITGQPKPILAYCRSGTRSTMLWSLSEAGQRSVLDILQRANSAGYDMTGLISRLEK